MVIKVIAYPYGFSIKDTEGKLIHEIRFLKEIDKGVFHLHAWCMSKRIDCIKLICQIDVVDTIEAVLHVSSQQNLYRFSNKVKAIMSLKG